jgi:hypothetical protein
MTARSHLPGMRWFIGMRNVALRTGLLTGIYLSCAFLAWLIAANRVSRLEPFAGVRNLCAGIAMILLMAIPIIRFHHKPAKLFISGLTAWTLLTLTYIAAEIRFSLLESRMGAFQIFMLGAISYGLIAAFEWVFLLCLETRHRHIAQIHGTASHANRSRTH